MVDGREPSATTSVQEVKASRPQEVKKKPKKKDLSRRQLLRLAPPVLGGVLAVASGVRFPTPNMDAPKAERKDVGVEPSFSVLENRDPTRGPIGFFVVATGPNPVYLESIVVQMVRGETTGLKGQGLDVTQYDNTLRRERDQCRQELLRDQFNAAHQAFVEQTVDTGQSEQTVVTLAPGKVAFVPSSCRPSEYLAFLEKMKKLDDPETTKKAQKTLVTCLAAMAGAGVIAGAGAFVVRQLRRGVGASSSDEINTREQWEQLDRKKPAPFTASEQHEIRQAEVDLHIQELRRRRMSDDDILNALLEPTDESEVRTLSNGFVPDRFAVVKFRGKSLKWWYEQRSRATYERERAEREQRDAQQREDWRAERAQREEDERRKRDAQWGDAQPAQAEDRQVQKPEQLGEPQRVSPQQRVGDPDVSVRPDQSKPVEKTPQSDPRLDTFIRETTAWQEWGRTRWRTKRQFEGALESVEHTVSEWERYCRRNPQLRGQFAQWETGFKNWEKRWVQYFEKDLPKKHGYRAFMEEGGTYYDEVDDKWRVNCGLGKHSNPEVAEFEDIQRIKKKALGRLSRKLVGEVLEGLAGFALSGTPGQGQSSAREQPTTEKPWTVIDNPAPQEPPQLPPGDVSEGEWREASD